MVMVTYVNVMLVGDEPIYQTLMNNTCNFYHVSYQTLLLLSHPFQPTQTMFLLSIVSATSNQVYESFDALATGSTVAKGHAQIHQTICMNVDVNQGPIISSTYPTSHATVTRSAETSIFAFLIIVGAVGADCSKLGIKVSKTSLTTASSSDSKPAIITSSNSTSDTANHGELT
ncbi:hypothetical protein Cgig2_011700 [Carnegiea gigantea]|uniref:Uncharacterized protein n=1 Tax=Carnegiea gigantea TaxID=171969 RepID=A0A9Q1Q8F0_9CARY|nr:hypothetical protein Cgig2_011700 [Carnegiea gigantea]